MVLVQMDELQKSAETLFAPLPKSVRDVLVPSYSQSLYFFLDFNMRYSLESPYGRFFIRSVANPLLVHGLGCIFEYAQEMKALTPLPQWTKTVLCKTANLVNVPAITAPAALVLTNLSLAYCDVMYDHAVSEEMHKYLFLGMEHNGKVFGVELGTGNIHDVENCFYPASLLYGVLNRPTFDERVYRELENEVNTAAGFRANLTRHAKDFHIHEDLHVHIPTVTVPYEHSVASTESVTSQSGGTNRKRAALDNSDISPQKQEEELRVHSSDFHVPLATASKSSVDIQDNRLKVAMSCLLFSTLAARPDCQLTKLLAAGMLPTVTYYSTVACLKDTRMVAFISTKPERKWAVFGFVGCDYDIIQHTFSEEPSDLDFFQTNTSLDDKRPPAKVSSDYYCKAKRIVGLLGFAQRFNGEYVTPVQLVKILGAKGYKLYFTGSGMGAAFATIFAAMLTSSHVEYEGLITFSPPPIGNQEFADWFNVNSKCNWRFVFGDDFAHLLPIFSTLHRRHEEKLAHVGALVHFERPQGPAPKTCEEAFARLHAMANDTGLMRTIIDHNPFLLLRALKQFRTQSKCALFLPTCEDKCHCAECRCSR